MKKLLLAMVALGLLAVSCKKDMKTDGIKPVTTNANAKKYKVTFTVNQFSQTVSNLSLKNANRLMSTKALAADTSSLSKALNRYFYLVYDANGKEIKRIIRGSAYPNSESYYHEDGKVYSTPTTLGLEYRTTSDPFNIITDSLAAGTYTIVVTGSNSEIEVNYDDTNYSEEDPVYNPLLPATDANDYYNKAAVYVGEGLDALPLSQEIYFFKCKIVVGSQNMMQNLTLNRVVGQLEVNLEDAIPSNVAYLAVIRDGELEGYSMYNEVPFGYTILEDNIAYQDVERSTINASDRGKPNYKTDRFIVNTATPFTVKIVAFDASNNIVAQKAVPNVRVYKNKRTILSGKLFGTDPAATQFTITANQAWGPDAPTVHF